MAGRCTIKAKWPQAAESLEFRVLSHGRRDFTFARRCQLSRSREAVQGEAAQRATQSTLDGLVWTR